MGNAWLQLYHDDAMCNEGTFNPPLRQIIRRAIAVAMQKCQFCSPTIITHCHKHYHQPASKHPASACVLKYQQCSQLNTLISTIPRGSAENTLQDIHSGLPTCKSSLPAPRWQPPDHPVLRHPSCVQQGSQTCQSSRDDPAGQGGTCRGGMCGVSVDAAGAALAVSCVVSGHAALQTHFGPLL